jgi:aminopeptidase N
MINMYKVFVFVVALLLASCGGTKEIVYQAPPIEEEMLDTLVVTAPPMSQEIEEEEIIPQELPYYNPSATRYMDIIHTDLDLRFDWQNQWVIGKAAIEMTPVFYPQSSVELDAKTFDIKKVMIGDRMLNYDYDGAKMTVVLDKTYRRGEHLQMIIEYIAKPNEGPEGGSAAITSDKGLFFINPLNEEANKPMQIWTQGETENNSRWFPTIDKPNERMTQKISLTVQDRFSTLSNGLLISSVNNGDGSRTDTWQQDQPHPPYLAMIGVGEYAVVTENVDGLDYLYYVEKAFGEDAKAIFGHTPEMVSFFSEKLDYPFPWTKYAQLIAKDYVSGAMENTTAVIFGDFVQKTTRELIDNDNDYIVAHELFHHWFGDLVTCESWANLTLQEGFANYSEYLWFEYKYGRDRADKHRMSEMEGYLMSAENQGVHPLIWYEHPDKELMFDAHSYNKGGLVLHMLRSLVGDEAFYASLNKYLKDNEYTAVEVDELRMAFEDVTGRDLNWFFNQWYLSAGHPTLDVKYEYVPEKRTMNIIVDQIQDHKVNLPVYRLDTEIAVYDQNGDVTYYPATMDTRKTQFEIEGIDQPSVVVYDGKSDLLAVIKQDRSTEEYMALLKYSDNYEDKITAARSLRRSPLFVTLVEKLLKEEHQDFRRMAVEAINLNKEPTKRTKVLEIFKNDPHSVVREAALDKLVNHSYADTRDILIDVLKGNDAYSLSATALNAFKRNNDSDIYQYSKAYNDVNHPAIISVLSGIYASSGNGEYLSYFEDKLESVSLFAMFNFYNKYYDLVKNQPEEKQLESAEKLAKIATTGSNTFRKFVATSTINKLEDAYKAKSNDVMVIRMRAILDKIISEETNDQLLARYQSF